MPVMDGITAARKIHQVFPELPIVAFSAEEGEVAQAKALGVTVALMGKPANSTETKRTIEEHTRPSYEVSRWVNLAGDVSGDVEVQLR